MQLDSYLADTKPNYSQLTPGTYWMICGLEKVGKTTACSTFSEQGSDGVLILDLEQGVRSDDKISINISSLNPPYLMTDEGPELINPIDRGLLDNRGNPIPSYSLLEALELLEATWESSGKTTLVIDTIDKLSDWCQQAAFEELMEEDMASKSPKLIGCTSCADIPYGRGYHRAQTKVIAIRDEILRIIGKNGIHLLPTHLKKTITIEETREVTVKRVPKMPEGLYSALFQGCEAIGTIEVNKDGKHFCDFRGYGEVVMGTRIEPLHNKKFLFGKDKEKTLYKVLMKECRTWQDAKGE